MKITNLTVNKLNLGFIGAHGRSIDGSGYLIVEDKYASHPSLGAMKDNGIITYDNFDVGDCASTASPFDKDPYGYLTASEFNNFVKGVFIVPNTWTKTGVPAASASAYALAGTVVGPFDTTEKYILKITFDSLVTVEVSLPRGQIDIATLVSYINLDTEFTKWGVADDDGGGHLRITSRAVGVNSLVTMEDHILSAVEKVGMETCTVTPAVGAISTVVITTLNPSGVGVKGIRHNIKLYLTDVGGGSVVSAEYIIQRVTVGTLVSGAYTAEAVMDTGNGGVLTFEVAVPVAITDPQDWVAVVLPASYYLAQVPVSRLQIA